MTAPIDLQAIRVLRDQNEVLGGLGLTLGRRERLAVMGPNGAGKTTLLRAIVGLERPESGQVRLFGQVCKTEADFRKQRPRIGFLFQESDDQLFCPTVVEDVAFGPCNAGVSDAEARVRALETLGQLGISHLAERITHRLSGGEKRLVCLAGLLAMRPEVLLLDEPTNGVDALNGKRLYAALEAFEGAILLVSHDREFTERLVTRTLVLRGGQLHDPDGHGLSQKEVAKACKV